MLVEQSIKNYPKSESSILSFSLLLPFNVVAAGCTMALQKTLFFPEGVSPLLTH